MIKKTLLFITLIFNTLLFAQHELKQEEKYALVKKATYYTDHHDYERAIQTYQVLLKDDPLNREYLNHLGNLYVLNHQIDLAKQTYLRVLHLYGDDVNASLSLATLYYEEGDYVQASHLLEQVVSKYPHYIPVVAFLAKSYIANKEWDKAEKLLNATVAYDPDNVQLRLLQGDVAVHQGEYRKGYKDYKVAWHGSKDNAILDRMIDLRPFARPSSEVAVEFSEERERDLVTKNLSVENNIWYTQLQYDFPIHDVMRFFVKGSYSPEQQKNKIADQNNYYVNNYQANAGIDLHYFNYIALRLQSNAKWGHNDGHNNLFPFASQFEWEPLGLLSVGSSHINYTASAFKESFVGRNFSDTTAFYVSKRTVDNRLAFTFFKGRTSFGGDGSLSILTGTKQTRLREFSLFGMQKIDGMPLKAILEYQYRYGNFTRLDRDYFTYRARYRHFGTVKLYYPWGSRHLIEARYTFKWQKLRDFVNIARQFTADNIIAPQILLTNVLRASELGLTAKFSIRDHLTAEASAEYYFDSNRYRTMSGRLNVIYSF